MTDTNPSSIDALQGRVLNQQFELQKKLGVGGFGSVWRARDTKFQRDVAIKVLHRELGSNAEIVKRFKAEGMIASQFAHPYKLNIYDLDQTEDGYLWLAMEFLSGKDLYETVQSEGPVRPEKLIEIFRTVCEILQEAHERGIVHRDLKPHNIFLNQYQGKTIPKILDFGISRITTEASSEQSRMVMGSFDYMAPEQFKGAMFATPRSDIYALAVIVYYALSGVLPLEAEDITQWAIKHFGNPETPKHLQERVSSLPKAFCDVVMQTLDRDPEKRPQSCTAFFEALEKSFSSAPAKPVAATAMYPSPFAEQKPAQPVAATAMYPSPFAEQKPAQPVAATGVYQPPFPQQPVAPPLQQPVAPPAQQPVATTTPSFPAAPGAVVSAPGASLPQSPSEEELRAKIAAEYAAQQAEREKQLRAEYEAKLQQTATVTAPPKPQPKTAVATSPAAPAAKPSSKSSIAERVAAMRTQQESEPEDEEDDTFTREQAAVEEAQEQGLRFAFVDDDRVIDTHTWLMWSLQDSFTENEECLDRSAAEEYCKSCEAGGYSDWRMPTIEELKDLYSAFSNKTVVELERKYWSQISVDEDDEHLQCTKDAGVDCSEGSNEEEEELAISIYCAVWAINSNTNLSHSPQFFFDRGGYQWQDVESTDAECGALPVRIWDFALAEEAAIANARAAGRRFAAVGDTMFIDTKTDLMWAAYDSGLELGEGTDWKASKQYCKKSEIGGYTDWRMPTLDELKELYCGFAKQSLAKLDRDTWAELIDEDDFGSWTDAAEVDITEEDAKNYITFCCCQWASDYDKESDTAAAMAFYEGSVIWYDVSQAVPTWEDDWFGVTPVRRRT